MGKQKCTTGKEGNLLFNADISDEQADSLSAMYDLSFVSLSALPRQLASIL